MEIGDSIEFTYNDGIDPDSILSGWTGSSANVVVRLIDSAGNDMLEVWNATNTSKLNLHGSAAVLLGNYASNDRTFGASGTPSTIVNTAVAGHGVMKVTLGTPSAVTNVEDTPQNMTWTPGSAAFDRAANSSTTTMVTESGASDVEF